MSTANNAITAKITNMPPAIAPLFDKAPPRNAPVISVMPSSSVFAIGSSSIGNSIFDSLGCCTGLEFSTGCGSVCPA